MKTLPGVPMLVRLLAAALLLAATVASAEDEAQRRAREELERQLNQMVGKQPTKVRVEFEALDEPMFKLEDASFELDGRALSRPSLDQLSGEGVHLVWNGDVTPGKHVVAARVAYANQASPVVSEEGGYTWKPSGTVSFDVHAGIEVRVKVTAQRDAAQKDISKRISIRLPATPVMLAKVDDGKMPEPPPKPVLLPEAVDAGTPVAVAAAAESAADEQQRKAEEKQRKAEEAAEKKRLAAEEKQRKAEEAKEARRLAAEEKQRKAEEAKEARRLAAEEKKRKAEEAKEAKRLAAEGKLPTPAFAEPLDAGPPEAPDAGAALAEAIVDAGQPLAVAEVVDAGAPGPAADAPPAEEEGLPIALLAGGAGALVLVLLVVLARRRSRLPKIDE